MRRSMVKAALASTEPTEGGSSTPTMLLVVGEDFAAEDAAEHQRAR